LLKGYFWRKWKVPQIILISKQEKPLKELIYYRAISLLPIVSKIFEMLLIIRLLPMVEKPVISSASDRGTPQYNIHLESFEG
jgi:hypothetical protein